MLIRADVAWESLAVRHVGAATAIGDDPREPDDGRATHAVINDQRGVVPDVEVTTGQTDEGEQMDASINLASRPIP